MTVGIFLTENLKLLLNMLTPEQIKSARIKYGLDTAPQPSESRTTPTGGGISDERMAELRNIAAGKFKTTETPQGETGLKGVAIGAGKGAISTLTGASGLGERMLGSIGKTLLPKSAERALGIENAPTLGIIKKPTEPVKTSAEQIVPEELRTAQGTAEKIGFGAEQIVEFFIPGGAATKLGKVAKGAKLLEKAPKILKEGAELIARAGTEAGTMVGMSALQGKTEGLGTVAGISAAIPVVGKVAGKVTTPIAKYLGEKLPPRIINSILKPVSKEFNFAKNPGKGVIEEKIIANTPEQMLKKISFKKSVIGKQIEEKLKTEGAGKTIDLNKTLTILDDGMQQAVNSGEQALFNRLQAIKDGLTKTFKIKDGKIIPIENISRKSLLSPEEAHALKREIGEATKWTGQAFDDDVNQIRVKLYQSLNDNIDSVVPGAKALQKRYANMLSAEKSLDRTMTLAERKNLLSLSDTLIGGGLGTAIGIKQEGFSPKALLYSLGGIAGKKILSSPAIETRIAQGLTKLAPQEKTTLERALPILRNVFLGIRTDEE